MRRHARGDERGVTLILFTLMLTVMLVFVALAMDSGLVFNERRQDQSAVDAAVLGAAQILLEGGTKADAEEAIITGTLENTKSTNDVPLEAPGGWRDRWASCSATVPPGFVAGVNACIAFHDSSGPDDPTQVWAHLPSITVGSTFGGVVGINEYQSTAEAIGEIVFNEPYAVFGAATECDGQGNVEQAVDIGNDSAQPIEINGPVHSNGVLAVEWQTATVNGFVTYRKPPPPPPPPIGPVDVRLTGVETNPLRDITIDDYVPGGEKADEALAAGQYRNAGSGGVDDAWLDDPLNNVLDGGGQLKNVLIYTTGPIDVNVPRQGRATFVSTGRIAFRSDGFNLLARTGDVLAFSSAGDETCDDEGSAMLFEGGNNTWNGVLYAPEGSISSAGQNHDPKTFNGGIVAFIVDLDGSYYNITKSEGLGAPPKVRLYK